MTLCAEALTITGRLDNVSATLETGAITAICGPNGAGKSTLLSSLAALIDTQDGQLLLDGKPLSSLSARKRAQRIGYLPQSGEVAWDVSVRQLVALGRLPHRDEGKAQVARAIAECQLDDLESRRMSTLSGGEKARALLSRVLAGEPQWILADEPLAALDLTHQLAILRVLRRQADAGCGVVLVLHDLALAMNHADRVLVLNNGRLQADSAPEEALSTGIIAEVWGVKARWLGEPGARALST